MLLFSLSPDEGNLMIRFMEVDEKSFRRARRTLLKGVSHFVEPEGHY